MGRLAGLAAFLMFLSAMACLDPDAPVRVTATPDIPATVVSLVQERVSTPVPTATPNIDATVEARLAATVAAMPTATPVPTNTPIPTPTPVPTATPTPTATPRPTPTRFAARTPRPTATRGPTNTPRPTNTPLPPLKYDRSLLAFGPVDGRLIHEPSDQFIEGEEGPNLKGDLLIEATFLNPYRTDNRYWEHGFLLKDGPARNHQYWLSIDSDGYWETFYRLGDTGPIGRRSEKSGDINRGPGASNLLQVVTIGDRGWVYINGELQGGLDLSVDTGGNVTTIFVDDEYTGVTRFEDFTVWRWGAEIASRFPDLDPSATPNPKTPAFGPVSGAIQHNVDSAFFAEYEGPSFDGDVMIEVTFEVPFAPNESHWNFGLWFGTERTDAFHLVELHSLFGGGYNHWRKSGRDSEWQGRRTEDVAGINLQKGEKNHVRVILIEREAWLYVNERRMGILNFTLGDIPAPSWIDLVIDDRDGEGFRYSLGGSTKFEDFTVWKWHPSLFELPDD